MKNYSPLHSGRKFLLFAAMLALSISALAQNPLLTVFEEWRETAGTQHAFYKATTINIPGTTHMMVCGATLNTSGNYDILIQRLDATGAVIWSDQYNGAGNGDDVATDVEVNTSTGDIYVTGSYFESSADSFNAITMMYDNSGNQQWVQTFNGTGSGVDGGTALLVDNSNGDVIIVGTTWSTSTQYDMLALKYDNTGSTIWTNAQDVYGLDDGLNKIYDAGGKGKVGGLVQDMFASWTYSICDLDYSSGAISVISGSYGPSPGLSRLADLAVDDTGNVYMTGFVYDPVTKYDLRVMKLDTSLNTVWSHDYDAGYNLDDEGTGLALDSHNNVIVVGYSKTVNCGKDYTLLKYNNSGSLQWIRNYNGTANGNDSASAVVIGKNDTDAIYVTGYSFNGATNDYWTIRMDGAGNQMWGIGMNSILNGDDAASAIAIDSTGGIVVTGQTKLSDTVFAYTTVKYIQKNVLLPDDTILYTSNSFIYTENRGQVMGTDSVVHPEIKFYTLGGSPQVFFTDTSVSYVFAKLDTSGADTTYRVDMHFVNSNQDMRIRPMDERADYCNFFMEHIPEGRSRVQNYNELVSFNVWNNVDIVYGNNLKGMKYYFMCKPMGGGGSAYQIDLQYSGADSIRIDASGQLLIYTPLGILVQPKAAAWELDGSGNFTALGWQPSYSLLGPSEVGFSSFGSYTPGNTLVIAVDWGDIQPQFSVGNQDWGTYFGPSASSGMTSINDNVINNSGQFYVCGYTYSSTFPVLNAYFGTHFGGKDVIVSKFDTDHSLLWSTYYGGALAANGQLTAADEATGIDLDINGNVFVTGYTQSVQLPHFVWGTAFDQTAPGSNTVTSMDAFILRMSSDGQTISWSTWYGGAGEDRPRDIKVCKNTGEIYIGGEAEWNTPILNAPVWSMGGGFLTKFDATGSHVWATHVGNGSSYTWNGSVNGIVIDANDDVVIVGHTISGTDLPIVNAGGNSTYAGGTYDGFVMKLSATGSSPSVIWSTYYGGGDEDQVCDIVTAKISGQIKYFIVGITQSSSSTTTIPLVDQGTGNYYQSDLASSGSWDVFIARIRIGGVVEWSTYFGGTSDDVSPYYYWSGADIAVNGQGDVFVTFSTLSSDVPLPSPNLSGAYFQSYSNTEAFIAAFRNSTHEYIWGTYFGGTNVERVHSIDCYNNVEVYISGQGANMNSTFPLEAGNGTPYYNPGGNYLNGFIASFGLATVVSVEETAEESLNVLIYPSPTINSVWISGTGDFVNGLVIEVVNVLGEVISQESLPPSNSINHQIDLSSCAEGVYFVKITSGDKVCVRKIEVTR